MLEYLRHYSLPVPPACRYGSVRFPIDRKNEKSLLMGHVWLPENARATVLFLHGYSEHTGNYSELIHDFLNQGFAVVALDLRGHGLSEGPKGHAPTSTSYVEDVEAFANAIIPQVMPNHPIFLWAHSLGSLVALQLVFRKKLFKSFSAVTISSPLLGMPPLTGMKKFLSLLSYPLSKVLPSISIDPGIGPEILSHDQAYLARRKKDHLIHRSTTPGWFVQIKQAIKQVQSHAINFPNLSPTLVLLAGDEKVTDLPSARGFAMAAFSGFQHKVIEFPDYYHELEKEPAIRHRVISESIAWFNNHFSK